MVIASTGLARIALLMTSTWTFMDIGTGTATVNLSDTDLQSTITGVSRHTINTASASGWTAYFKVTYTKSEGNNTTGSNITEIGMYDASVYGNQVLRTVSSTATFTAFAKTSSLVATISTSISATTG